MLNIARKVKDAGGYLKGDSVEWRVIKNCNHLYELQMRFIREDESDTDNEWNTVFISGSL